MITTYYRDAKSKGTLKVIKKPRAGALVVVTEPTKAERESLEENYGLDHSLLKDAMDEYEYPRVEQDYEYNTYIFSRYCSPEGQTLATQPVTFIHSSKMLFVVLRTKTDIFSPLLSSTSEIFTSQRTKLMMQFLKQTNFSYQVYLRKISRELLIIRAKLKKTEISNQDFISFIEIEEDLNEILSALQPNTKLMDSLLSGKHVAFHEEDKDLLEDINLNIVELTELTKSQIKTISNTREAYSTIMANTLNKTFKKLTSISIFMTIPTITAGLYGMNLSLPLASNHYAFWYILIIVMIITSLTIYIFQRKKWL